MLSTGTPRASAIARAMSFATVGREITTNRSVNPRRACGAASAA